MSATAPVAGLLAAAAVCTAVAGSVRRHHRAHELRVDGGRSPARRPLVATVARTADAALARLGARLRGGCGRPADPRADRILGRAVGSGVVLAAVHPLIGVVVAVAVWSTPTLVARHRAVAARRAVVHDLPDLVDLFRVAVGAGANVAQAVALVDRRTDGPVGDALAEVRRTAALGRPLAEALEAALVLGDPVRPLVAALVSAERDGAAVVEPLRAVADDARTARRRAAEERARRLPVLLLFPLVLCILPAFTLLTVVPVLMGILRSFEL